MSLCRTQNLFFFNKQKVKKEEETTVDRLTWAVSDSALLIGKGIRLPHHLYGSGVPQEGELNCGRARFQQKQMQEKEQKLLRLYESQTQRAFQRVGRGSAGSSSSSVSSTSSSLGAGKVRQLFQERRHQTRSYTNGNKTGAAAPTGWDRSYPLEPLENSTKQRLQASKSTGNLKVARGTSLERSYSNNIAVQNQYQAKTQARRSKSQVRSNHLQQNVVVDLGGSFRQLSHSQQKLYDHEDYEDDDDDVVEYPQNHYSRDYQDEENNRILLEREQRESELFNKHRIYDDEDDDDIENEDPPFQQLDDVDDFNDSSHVFQKLPNVGGRLLMENRANNNNNNVDRYKTYNATTNGIRNNRRSLGDREETSRRVTPPAAREPPQRRREQETAPATRPAATKVTVTAPARRSDMSPGHVTGVAQDKSSGGAATLEPLDMLFCVLSPQKGLLLPIL
ncbi:hypothetical protein ANN_21515 [Periplaneta americana]|uniref:Uncharacterized protein n=1 Tax=Periplaneta americana TaxID=6978 RepID=A0ABQ8SGQ1_PERAM|nr:hypothetical protein ANN_21515 [Periplaneta americana]